MAHVCIEGFRARHRQEDASENDDAEGAVGVNEGKPRDRTERLQNAPLIGDVEKPKRGVHDEEHEHDRTEERGDTGGSAALRGKEQHEDDDRRGQYEGSKFGVDLLQPFQR